MGWTLAFSMIGPSGATGPAGSSLILGIPSNNSNPNDTYLDQATGNLYAYFTTGIITTIAGTGTGGYDENDDGAAATAAQLDNPNWVAVDVSGNVYIADTVNQRIRKIDAGTGIITTIAGTGLDGGFTGDNGPATAAQLDGPRGVAVDISGNVYIADTINHRIRKIDASGNINTIAGTGTPGYNVNQDGNDATDAQLNYPYGVAVDISGNVYIADTINHRIRKIDASGNINTIAGTGTAGYSTGGGVATSAQINNSYGLAVDDSGNVYIVDTNNHRIRKIDASGNINTIAGTGLDNSGNVGGGFSGDGSVATSAQINNSYGLAVDISGNVYIADTDNSRIRKIDASGNINTIAGTGLDNSGNVGGGFSGDGSVATVATLNYPVGVAIDISGNVYIADTGNNRIRKFNTGWQITGNIMGASGVGTALTENFMVAGGVGTNDTLGYSYNGIYWFGSGNSIFDTACASVAWNGSLWVAGGGGTTNTLAYSSDGITWTGLGNTIFDSGCITVAWNGSLWVAGGLGTTNTLAYSPDGITWTGLGNTIFDTGCLTVAWNGSMWVAGGQGTTNTLAYSYNGSYWFGLEKDVFDSACSSVAWNGSLWVAGGEGTTNTLAYSSDGITWTGLGNTIFDIGCRSVAWNGSMWVAGGEGNTDTLGYSYDGINWIGSGNSIFDTACASVAWNGSLWVAGGAGTTNTLAYSSDGITWTGLGNSIFDTGCATLASRRPLPYVGGAIGSTSSSIILGIPTNNSNPADTYLDTLTGNLYKVSNITTIAGTGAPGFSGEGVVATDAQLYAPLGVAVDTSGNVYIADRDNNRIRKIDAGTGTITTIAGTGTGGYSNGNGYATSAQLGNPYGVAVDISGNVYIADLANSRIRKIDFVTATITTIAGTWTGGFSGDGGVATDAQLDAPGGIALDLSGNVYIADINNNRIRKIDASGNINTIAGTGLDDDSNPGGGFSGDGDVATDAQLNNPYGVAVDVSGNVYISDTVNHIIRKIDASGNINTIAGTPETGGFSGDTGLATAAQLNSPRAVAVDISGNVYIADLANSRIRKIDASGNINTIAGTGAPGFSNGNGVAIDAQLYNPEGVTVDVSGNVYIADTSNYRIRKVYTIDDWYIIGNMMGVTGQTGDTGATGPGSSIIIGTSLANTNTTDTYLDQATGNLLTYRDTITIAGTGIPGYSSNHDGYAPILAQLYNPYAVHVDVSGNVYIADTSNHIIRKIGFGTGTITTIAGTGAAGYSGDGDVATAAQLNSPYGVAVDVSGNVYIADSGNHRIRMIDASGNINTIAGTETAGFYGDGDVATDAQLYTPYGIDVDISGNVYIADSSNLRIRKIDASGNINTIAGTAAAGFYGDGGVATDAQLNYPFGVAVDVSGNVYIADSSNHRIRMIDASGNINTIAGTGGGAYYIHEDGYAATAAQLNYPQGIAVDVSGNVYIADTYNQRIRKIDNNGIITTINIGLYYLYGVAVDVSGNVYIADTSNHRILKINVLGWQIAGNISITYYPSNTGHWVYPAPRTLANAIDRLAALLYPTTGAIP